LLACRMQGFCASCLSCIMLAARHCMIAAMLHMVICLNTGSFVPELGNACQFCSTAIFPVKGCKEIVLWDLRSCSSFAEDLSLLGCYAMLLGLLFVMFQRNVVSPLSGSGNLRTLLGLLDPDCEFSVIIQSIRCWALNDRVALSKSLIFLILYCISCKKLPTQISLICHVFWQQY
jgi:hypothetical protein